LIGIGFWEVSMSSCDGTVLGLAVIFASLTSRVFIVVKLVKYNFTSEY